jgi:hypothetical protein
MLNPHTTNHSIPTKDTTNPTAFPTNADDSCAISGIPALVIVYIYDPRVRRPHDRYNTPGARAWIAVLHAVYLTTSALALTTDCAATLSALVRYWLCFTVYHAINAVSK